MTSVSEKHAEDPSFLCNPSPPRDIARVAVLLVAICAAAAPGMQSPLILDDIGQIHFVETFDSWTDFAQRDWIGVFRPIKNVIYWLFARSGQPVNITAWHMANLSAFLLASTAAYALFKRIFNHGGWALAAAALWALSPTQTINAIWMSCITINISVFFACLSLLFHDRARSAKHHQWRFLPASAACLFMAQFSYETALALPGALVFLDIARKRKLFSKQSVLSYSIVIGTTLLYLAIRQLGGAFHTFQGLSPGFDPNLTKGQLAASSGWFLWRHLSMWFAPFGRTEFASSYIWSVSAPIGTIVLAWITPLAIASIWVLARKHLPLAALGCAWFLVFSLPTSNLVPIFVGPVEDYYLAFPSLGLALFITECARFVHRRFRRERRDNKTHRLALATILLFIGIWRFSAALYFPYLANLWRNPAKLYVLVSESRPAQHLAKLLTGIELFNAGENQTAIVFFNECRREAPWLQNAHMMAGLTYEQTGQFNLAGDAYRQAEKLENGANTKKRAYLQFHEALALCKSPDRKSEGRSKLTGVIRTPNHPFRRKAILALADLQRNDPKAQEKTLEHGLRIFPESGELKQRLGKLREHTARFPGKPGN